uniref:Putative inactive leucine-rich repeat receptor-like protein kinase n=1 Tax=Sedum alfredii TaxID=439688 RepID=A0A410N676_9MAGN|nr:putative inactive leucine-rich repeat receptor-like protein kinase [Sedum alfredii]
MKSVNLEFQWWRCQTAVFLVLLLCSSSSGLNSDGNLLLKFKSSILNDSLQVLSNWYFWDQTPCTWNGVTCGNTSSGSSRVVSLSLPNSQLLGSIPSELLTIQYLQHLNLANNSFNGSLPFSMLNSTSNSQLSFLDLSNNWISGEIPNEIAQVLQNLQVLNLSDNALAGNLPSSLSGLTNLTVISLKNNYFTGELPNNFNSVQYLDLSSNLINCSFSNDFGGQRLAYFNISYNRLFGEIPQTLADKVPENATIDVSFNNLTGQIPNARLFINQAAKSFTGNPDLCGRPLRNPCTIPSTLSNPPNVTNSPPAIAAIPKTIPGQGGNNSSSGGTGLRLGAILGIVIGDLVGILILGFIFLYVYRVKKRRNAITDKSATTPPSQRGQPSQRQAEISTPNGAWCACLPKRETEDYASSASTSDSDENDESSRRLQSYTTNSNNVSASSAPSPKLVTIDGGDADFDLETLLKASAYILGATGSTILYKAVLETGSVLAVRRIGETGPDHRFKDFENQIRAIGKLVHPNVVRVKGFYVGPDQKLIIYEFVPNGSLATARYRKPGSSPCLLPWEVRLKIAKGVARGLAYIHDKKHVHGNLKPSNVLLGFDFEPKVGFGMERLLVGDVSNKVTGSSRIFGSKRSTTSRDSFHDTSLTGLGLGSSPSPSPSSFGMSPYAAPESLRSIKPNSKWDVYSFGVMFLELLTGKVTSYDESGQSNMEMLFVEDRNRVLRMADVTIRGEVEGKEEALLACFKLGIVCVSASPQKRPSMKEVMQALDKLPSSSSASSFSSPHFYGGF